LDRLFVVYRLILLVIVDKQWEQANGMIPRKPFVLQLFPTINPTLTWICLVRGLCDRLQDEDHGK